MTGYAHSFDWASASLSGADAFFSSTQLYKNQKRMHNDRRFEHSMLREIFDLPQALAGTMKHCLQSGNLRLEAFRRAAEVFQRRERMVIATSGPSRYAGLATEIMVEDLAGLAVDVAYANEYCYRTAHAVRNPCLLVTSQSGATVDTLATLREAKARRLETISLTN